MIVLQTCSACQGEGGPSPHFQHNRLKLLYSYSFVFFGDTSAMCAHACAHMHTPPPPHRVHQHPPTSSRTISGPVLRAKAASC